MSVVIKYKNSTIADVDDSCTKILKTRGTYCDDDIIVKYIKQTITEISTDDDMNAVLVSENAGKIYKFTGVSGTYVNGDLYIVEGVMQNSSYVFLHYGYEDYSNYLCFTAEEVDSTISMSVDGTPTKGQAFEISIDGETWSAFIPGVTDITLSNVGDKVYFRGDNTTVNESTSTYYAFVMTGKISASGNVMSLLDKTCQSKVILNDSCYYNMFHGCTSLTTAPELPATSLASSCYNSMFRGCTSLTTAPELPATAAPSSCYNSMFHDCKSLTTAPALPATALTTSCYNSMFRGCTSLTTAPALPATSLASNCYKSMFYGCASLTTASALPATRLANSCYEEMFRGCTSLTTAPELPATRLASNCYKSMFYGCRSLQIYSSSGTGHEQAWPIPTKGTASSYKWQNMMFYSCPGDYINSSSVTLNETFYTQNAPVK